MFLVNLTAFKSSGSTCLSKFYQIYFITDTDEKLKIPFPPLPKKTFLLPKNYRMPYGPSPKENRFVIQKGKDFQGKESTKVVLATLKVVTLLNHFGIPTILISLDLNYTERLH